MFRSAAVVVFVLTVAGCKPVKPIKPIMPDEIEKSDKPDKPPDMEKALQSQMTAQMKVEITSVRLTQRADGTFAGTATAADGTTFDVTTSPDPKHNGFEWTAVTSPASVERLVRDRLAAHKLDVSTLYMKKQPEGGYGGTATTTNGDTFEIEVEVPPRDAPAREEVMLNVTPGQATVERLVGEDIEKDTGVKVKSFALNRKGPGVYTGTATQENDVLTVTTKMDGPQLTWTFRSRKQP